MVSRAIAVLHASAGSRSGRRRGKHRLREEIDNVIQMRERLTNAVGAMIDPPSTGSAVPEKLAAGVDTRAREQGDRHDRDRIGTADVRAPMPADDLRLRQRDASSQAVV